MVFPIHLETDWFSDSISGLFLLILRLCVNNPLISRYANVMSYVLLSKFSHAVNVLSLTFAVKSFCFKYF